MDNLKKEINEQINQYKILNLSWFGVIMLYKIKIIMEISERGLIRGYGIFHKKRRAWIIPNIANQFRNIPDIVHNRNLVWK